MLRRRSVVDSGYSLVEMLVTIIMFTLVAGSITAVVITTLKHQNSLAERSSVLAATRNSLENVDRDIRAANPLCAASTTEVTMYEPTSSSIVDYQVQGTDLVYTQYNALSLPSSPAPTNPTCTQTTTAADGTVVSAYWDEGAVKIAHKVVLANLTTNAIFTGQAVQTAFDQCPVGVNPATIGSANNIAILTVSVSVQPVSLSKPVTTSDCGTYLRNYDVPITVS
jgi:type II secretory pathway pseudopilin PulG